MRAFLCQYQTVLVTAALTEPEVQSADASSSSLPSWSCRSHTCRLKAARRVASPSPEACGRHGRPHQPFGPKCFPTRSCKAGPQSPGMTGSGQWRGSTRSDTAARGGQLRGGAVAKNVGSRMSIGSPAPADRPSLDVIVSKKEADAVLRRGRWGLICS